MIETILILTLIVLFGSYMIRTFVDMDIHKKSMRAVDGLFQEDWNGLDGDELLAWYRVRRQVMTDPAINHAHRQARLDAINIRIEQVRAKNTQWYSILRDGGRLTITSTRN